MNYFAQNINLLLKKDKLNQKTLGIIIGKKRSVVGSYIRGESQPNIDILIIIAEHFQITLDLLIRKDLSKIDLSDMTPAALTEEENILIEMRDKINYIHKSISKNDAKVALEDLSILIDKKPKKDI